MRIDRFEKKVLEFIRKNCLIKEGDKIIAGLSGGADSVALLLVLLDLKPILKYELRAAHVNHCLRAKEADRDEAFCVDLAKRKHIELDVVRADVKGLILNSGMTEEEAARILRYEAFNMLGDEIFGKPYKIAVAHHADDQAETILFNMARGSGMKGLSGMRPMRDNIIRPLIMTGKTELVDWLKKRGENFVTDSTNLENDHSRNIIRNIIMPKLKEDINERAAEHIYMAGEKIRQADDFIMQEALNCLNAEGKLIKIGPDEKRLKLGRTKLKEKPQILRSYVIIEALRMLGVPLKDMGEKHFNDIDKLLFLGNGAHIDLPGNIMAENAEKETFIISRKDRAKTGKEEHGVYNKYIDRRR